MASIPSFSCWLAAPCSQSHVEHTSSCSSAYSHVLSHNTMSSANSIAWGGPLPTYFDMTYITVMNNNGLSAEPWCRPTFTSKHSVDPISVLTDVVHPSYISCIILMYSSPTFFFLSAHHIIYLGTRSYAFSRSTKIICRYCIFSKCFSCILRSAKIGSVVDFPCWNPYWVLLISITCLSLSSTSLSNSFIPWHINFIPL